MRSARGVPTYATQNEKALQADVSAGNVVIEDGSNGGTIKFTNRGETQDNLGPTTTNIKVSGTTKIDAGSQVNTGDDNSLLSWIVPLLVSGEIMITLSIRRNKKEA